MSLVQPEDQRLALWGPSICVSIIVLYMDVIQFNLKVMPRHRELDPLCPFISNPNSSGNVPSLMPTQLTTSGRDLASVAADQPDEGHRSTPDYTNEQCRLATFANWPVNF